MRRENIGFSIFLLLPCVLLISFIQPTINLETKTIFPIADSHVSRANPNSNYGGFDGLEVRNSSVEERIAFVMFDLTEIPSSASVNSGILRLYPEIMASTYLRASCSISVHYSPNDTWNESNITYNNQPSFLNTSLSTVVVASDYSWHEWAITSAVQSTIQDAERKLTLVLTNDYHEGADWVTFLSKDSGSELNVRPQLVISYEIPSAPTDLTGTITPIGAAVGGIVLFIIVIVMLGSLRVLMKKQRKP